MDKRQHRTVYLGHADSTFSVHFIAALDKMFPGGLKLVFIDEQEGLPFPGQPGFWLRSVRAFIELRRRLHHRAAQFYWSVYAMMRGHAVFFTGEDRYQELFKFLDDCDYLVTAGLRHRLPERSFANVQKRAINFHYGPLPQYRGTHPVFWQRAHREKTFGYCFHLLSPGLDEGDVLFRAFLPVDPGLTDAKTGDLLTRHAALNLPRVLNAETQAVPQDRRHANHYRESDYLRYIAIDGCKWQEAWERMAQMPGRYLLDDRYIIHLKKSAHATGPEGLGCIYGKILLRCGGRDVEIERVNYLPAMFYFWPLKKIFDVR
jgi:folate-dependent phosphoribosylglycinamide formyltransferase PurN